MDHVAARSVHDPALVTDRAFTHRVLRTAAEASHGGLDCLVMPGGDLKIPLPLLGAALSNMDGDDPDLGFRPTVDLELTPQTWVEAFELCLVSGLVWESERLIGPLLRQDHAPVVRHVTTSAPASRASTAGPAQMNALGLYLTPMYGRQNLSEVVLCKPSAAERAEAARALDTAKELTAEQSLLRVLLE